MTVHHLVQFRLRDDAPADTAEAIATALRRLPETIDVLRSYHVGPDLGLADGNWDFGVAATFDSSEDWAAYTAHPDHQAVIAELIRPNLAERAAVQFET